MAQQKVILDQEKEYYPENGFTEFILCIG